MQGCDTDKWCLCQTGRFSYGESPRNPPLEGTSLHRWNNSVERPWGILSLFTTSLPVIQSPCHRLWHMSPTPEKARWEESIHTKCEKEQNHSEEELGRRKCKNKTEKEAISTNKGTMLKIKMNGTTMKRTWIEPSVPQEKPKTETMRSRPTMCLQQ